ncbi:radical SAM protein [bacterium]|nr:radical SAM protein [bacterium]
MNAREAKSIEFPKHLMVQTVSRCNSGCVMCPWPDTAKTQAQGEMDDAVYARLVDEVKRFPDLSRVLLYLMNEPTLDKKLPARIEMMRRALPHAEIYIITNGLLLDGDFGERLIDSGLSWLGISIHALEPDTYEKITGRKDWATARPRLERFIDRALAVRGDNFIQVNITKVRPHITPGEYARAAEHWREIGVTRVDLDDGYISRAGSVPVYGHERAYTPRTSGCKTIWAYKMAHVLFNGDVIPCCMDWRRKVVFGNVARDGGLAAVWRGEGRARFLDALGSGERLPDEFLCVSCEDAIPAEGANLAQDRDLSVAATGPHPGAGDFVAVNFIGKPNVPIDTRDAEPETPGCDVSAASDSERSVANPRPLPPNAGDDSPASYDLGDAVTIDPAAPVGPATEMEAAEDGNADALFFLPPPWQVSAPPLGIGAITGYLREKGWRVKVLDGNVRLYNMSDPPKRNLWDWERGPFWEGEEQVDAAFGDDLRTLAEEAAASGAKVFGINMVSRKEVPTRIFLKRLKELAPDSFVFVGGPHASHIDLRRHVTSFLHEFIDGFLVGEGEAVMEALLTRIREGRDILDCPGLARWDRVEGEETLNAPAFFPDLAALPPPDFRDFDANAYGSPALVVEWSRGCVGRCTFCNIPDLWQDARYKPAANVVRELRTLVERHGTKIFSVVDPMVNNDPAMLEAICDGIIEANLDVTWSAGMSPNRPLTAEQFHKMKQAGCYRLEFGVESGSDRVLRRMNKYYDAAEAGRMLQDAHAAGIDVVIYLIAGFPGETDEDVEATLRFLEENRESIGLVRSLNGLVIIHGTPIEKKSHVFGIEPIDRLENGWTNHWVSGDNTPDLRAKRVARIERKLHELGIRIEFQNTEDVMPSEMLYAKKIEDTQSRLDAVGAELIALMGRVDKVLRGEPVREVPGHNEVALVLCPVWGVDMPPLGMATVAGFMRNQGYDPLVVDLNIELYQAASPALRRFFEEDSFRHWTDEDSCRRIVAAFSRPIDAAVARIIESGRRVVGFTVYSPNRLFTIEVMRRLRRANPEIIHIIGGRGIQTENERRLFPHDLVDHFVIGEGEVTFIPLLERIFRGGDPTGLPGTDRFVGRDLAGYTPRPRLSDLTLLPPPAYDLFPLDAYRGEDLPVQFSRGCVAFCTFCNDNNRNTGFRTRPGSHIASELRHLVETTGRKSFRFNDLLINGDLQVLEELCDDLIAMDLGIRWIALFQPRGDMTGELLQKMATAGCYTLNMGVESGSDRVLKRMGKGFRVDDMERALKQARSAGINTMLNFFVGFPGEQEEDVDITIDFIRRNREWICGITSLNSCILLEDAPIEKNWHKLGIEFDDYATRDVGWRLGDNTPEVRMARLAKLTAAVKELGLPIVVTNAAERAADIDVLPEPVAEPEIFEEETTVVGANLLSTMATCAPALDDFDPSKGEPRWETVPADFAHVMLIKCPVWGVDVPPLAIAYLAQVSRDAGFKVVAVDMNVKIHNRCHDRSLWRMDRYKEWADPEFFPATYESLWELTEHYLKQIAAHPARLVGFSVCTSNYLFTMETARRLKKLAPEKVIVFGGPAITNSFDVQTLTPADGDYLFFGEGDVGFPEIVSAANENRAPKDVYGLVKIGTSFTYDSVDRALVKKGTSIPTPTMEELNVNEYTGTAIPLLGSRGCVRKCTFCNDHQIYQKYRHRPAKEIFADMEWHVLHRGAHHFTFLDLLMNGHVGVLEEFCDLILEKGYQVAWGGQCIIRKEMTLELLSKMRKAGCMSIVYGIESFNNKVLRVMRKYYTQELAKEVLGNTVKAGIEPIINIICGFPGEGEEEFLDTYNFIRDNRDIIGQVASVSPCLVNLGSELFERFEDFDIRFAPEGGSVKWFTADGSNTYEKRLERVIRVTSLLAERNKHIHTVNIYDEADRDQRDVADNAARERARMEKIRREAEAALAREAGGEAASVESTIDFDSLSPEAREALANGLATAALATDVNRSLSEKAARVPRRMAMAEHIGHGDDANGKTGNGNGKSNGNGHSDTDAGPLDAMLLLAPPWGVNFPPMGIASIATAAREKGFAVVARDLNVECYASCDERLKRWWEPENLKFWQPGEKFDAVAKAVEPRVDAFIGEVKRRKPRVVGLSTNESNLPFSCRVARRVREVLPDAKIILGGPGTAWPVDRQKLVGEAFDAVMLGEGELNFPRFLSALRDGEDLSELPGIEWMSDDPEKICRKPTIDETVRPLDQIPVPLFDDFNLDLYRTRQLPLMMGRGCVNRCTFCNDPQITPKYRYHSAEKMLEIVKFYQDRYGVTDFQFNDLLINGYLKNLRRFAELVIENNVEMHYSGQAIIDTRMDDETLLLLQQSGCTSLVFGVESFSDKVLGLMKKGFTAAEAREVMERCTRAGIKVIVNLIVGFPGETEIELTETMDFLRENRDLIDSISALSACIVTAQSPLENDPKRFGIVLPKPEHWCQWYSEDGMNTYEVRQKRLYRMLKLIEELRIPHGMTNRYLEMVGAEPAVAAPPIA